MQAIGPPAFARALLKTIFRFCILIDHFSDEVSTSLLVLNKENNEMKDKLKDNNALDHIIKHDLEEIEELLTMFEEHCPQYPQYYFSPSQYDFNSGLSMILFLVALIFFLLLL